MLNSADTLTVKGIMRFRAIPAEWSHEDYLRYYPRLSERDRERLTVHEAHNILTSAGRNQILTFIGASASNTAPFCQFWAVGTFPITTVNPGDTAVNGEIFRVAQSLVTITGTQIDLNFQIGSTQAVGTLTNAGLFGINATVTSGSGTLMTHALLNNFVKANGQAYAVDYLVNLT